LQSDNIADAIARTLTAAAIAEGSEKADGAMTAACRTTNGKSAVEFD
jgi:hypothetical protein